MTDPKIKPMSALDAQLGQSLCRRIRPSAKEHVDQALRACLPKGVEPSYRTIDAARYISAQPRHEATADLTMFDGRPAKVRVWLYARNRDAFAHEWLDLPGGHCSYEDGRWMRIDPVSLEPFTGRDIDTIGSHAGNGGRFDPLDDKRED